ncbi:MAG TPA: FKBP-type peptidyl-prolyl cis-trans isomerase [Ginsengibacter sp.]
MNKLIGFAAMAILLFAVGCKDQNFKKTKKMGIEYRASGGSGDPVKYGNSIKFQVSQYYNDSLMASPFDTVAQVIEIDSAKLGPDYTEIFTSAKNGDSVFTRMATDSLAKSGPLPPFAKKGPGQYFAYHFKILDIVTDPAKVAAIRNQSMESMKKIDSISTLKQKGVDDSILTAYLTKNNIKATKTAMGTYVEIIDPGTGDSINSGKAITVDYRGKTLEGKEFDSSYDSAGKSVKPYTFVIGQRGAIEGWSDGLVYFKKGGKGKLFIPSYLAYGSRGAGADIKPNTPLMFDVSIVDVLTQDQYRTKMEAQQKEMQEKMKKMREMQKPAETNPDAQKSK